MKRHQGRGRAWLRTGAILCTATMVVSVIHPAAAYPRPGRTTRASLAYDGSEADHRSQAPVISAEGRYVAFESFARNLVPGGTDGGWNVFLRDVATGTTEIVSVSTDGTEGDRGSSQFDMSADGQRIAFRSPSTNLVEGDTNGDSDVFVRDREDGTTVRVSIGSDGAEANGSSLHPAISADGRFVSFRSRASNLVPGDTNGEGDVFVHDVETGVTERVSIATDGEQAEDDSFLARTSPLSADGRFVVFESVASNLVEGDTNEASDIFVRDRQAGTTERVSVVTGGSEGNGASTEPAISADGRFVAFLSAASNLVPGDTNGESDVFVHDRATGMTERVSVAGDGAEAGAGSDAPTISADGRHVAFESHASNLVPDDTNDPFYEDVFVRDRLTRSTDRVSVAGDGTEGDRQSIEPSMTAHGRHVAFASWSSGLVPGDDNGSADVFVRDRGPVVGIGEVSAKPAGDSVSAWGWATFSGAETAVSDPPDDGASGADDAGGELTGAGVVHRPEPEDLLVRLSVDSMPSVGGGGGSPGTLYGLEFSVDGTAYEARAARSTEGTHFGLHRCDPSCERVTTLSGGIGTVGTEVLISVPTDVLGAAVGALRDVRAFTAIGDEGSGAVSELDEVAVPDVTIAEPAVSLGIAEAGTPPEDVEFGADATVDAGSFSGELDASSLPSGQYDVWAKACHGAGCGAGSVQITVEDGSLVGATELSFTEGSAQAGQFSDEATFEARLQDAGGDPLSGRPLTFDLVGDASARSFTTTTDDSGVGQTSEVVEQPPGNYRVTVTFDGEATLEPSSAEMAFRIDKEDTNLELVAGQADGSTTLTARLSDLDTPTTGIAGRAVIMHADDDVVGSGQTDDDGVVTVSTATANADEPVYKAVFDGDDHYLGSSDTVYPPPGRTDRISVGSDGEANEDSNMPSGARGVSAGGSLVAFHSFASNLVPGDTNRAWDVFVRDRETRKTERISVATDGTEGGDQEDSFGPAITPSGSHVAFWSQASTLVAGDENGRADVFVKDMATGAVERVSVATDGSEGDGDSFTPSISDDGRFVAFPSDATNLVPDDDNDSRDIFVHDREAGATTRVSVSSDGTQANHQSSRVSLSANGRFVSFRSFASNLVEGDTNAIPDVFVRDLQASATERISVASDGSEAAGSSDQSAISADGRYVAFRTHASNLVPEDTPDSYDVFVRDREAGTTERVSIGTNGEQPNNPAIYLAISADGRYVTFASYASNLVDGDTNATGGLFSGADVFVHDRQTRTVERVSVASDGTEGDGESVVPSISPDGRHVAYHSTSTNLVPGDTNADKGAGEDVFLRDRGPLAGVGQVSAQRDGDAISVSGWASFTPRVTTASDPADDGVSGAREAGGEITGAGAIVRPETEDLLVRLSLASLPSSAGSEIVYALRFSAGGSVYEVRAVRSVGGQRFGLYRCAPSCERVETLIGGIGTAGPEVLVSVPVSLVGGLGGALADVTAYTALGESDAGRLDEAGVPDVQLVAPEVLLGVVPAGTAEQDVEYDLDASVTGESFSGELDASALEAGEYEVWARGCLVDVCGAARATKSLTVVDVATPVVTAPADGALLASTTVDVSGTGEPAASILVSEEGVELGLTSVAGDGSWSVTLELTEGQHTITVTQTDGQGNTSEGVSRTFTIDVSPPEAPVLQTPVEGSTISTSSVDVTGTAEPGALVRVLEAGTEVATATAGDSGSWSVEVSFAEGTHSIEATATDAAGNTGPSSGERTFTVDLSAPDLAITGVPDPIQDAHADHVVVRGTSEPGVRVSVSISDGTRTAGPVEAPVDDAGDWQGDGIDVRGLANGTVVVTAEAVDGAGNTATAASTVEKATSGRSPVVVIGSNGEAIRDASAVEISLTYRGPSSEVDVELVVSDENGDTVTGPVVEGLGVGETRTAIVDVSPLSDGVLTATASFDGVEASDTAVLDRSAPDVTIDDPDAVYLGGAAFFSTMVFTGTASDDLSGVDFVYVRIERGPSKTVSVAPDGTWEADFRDQAFFAGSRTVIARAIDHAGNASTDAEAEIFVV